MPQDIYTIISLALRYWFAFLGILIVWRSFSWLWKDRRQAHRRRRELPDAGMIGELVVIRGSDELPEDTFIPVPREGMLGCLRTCDVVVPVSGVERQHLEFLFVNGEGLQLTPYVGCSCMVDGELIDDSLSGELCPMRHHSLLAVGDAVLRLRIFAGLDAPETETYLPDDYMDSFESPQDDDDPDVVPQDAADNELQHPDAAQQPQETSGKRKRRKNNEA